MLALLALPGCAAHKARLTGVPIEQRPTPPQPPPDSTTAMVTPKQEGTAESRPSTPTPTPTPNEPASPPPPVQAVMSPEERKATMQRIVADTTAASVAVGRCVGKTLLPDLESVFETTRSYLVQARAAIARGELWSAEGLARKARQLAASLECH